MKYPSECPLRRILGWIEERILASFQYEASPRPVPAILALSKTILLKRGIFVNGGSLKGSCGVYRSFNDMTLSMSGGPAQATRASPKLGHYRNRIGPQTGADDTPHTSQNISENICTGSLWHYDHDLHRNYSTTAGARFSQIGDFL